MDILTSVRGAKKDCQQRFLKRWRELDPLLRWHAAGVPQVRDILEYWFVCYSVSDDQKVMIKGWWSNSVLRDVSRYLALNSQRLTSFCRTLSHQM